MLSLEELYKIYLQYPHIVTDSRKITRGCLFFALRGTNFNGNDFALQALENGAVYAIVDRESLAGTARCLYCTNVLETLQLLARHHRNQFDIPIIAITGSNGKTTTKELVYAVLSSHYHTHATQGNFNNEIGVPLTLLAMPEQTEIAIIEMGANHQGEIEFLCRIAEPTHGLITNIGKAHLEGFGGFEGVKKGKSELYRYLRDHRGLIFLNMNERHLSELAENTARKILYARSQHPDRHHIPVEGKFIAADPYVRMAFLNEQWELTEINSRLIGSYNFNNILTAVTLGKYFKVPSQKIKAAIEGYIPANNRSQLVQKGSNHFILDAYNANPSSMRAALEHFAHTTDDLPRIAILGDMLELGKEALAEHHSILQYAQQLPLQMLLLVGSTFSQSYQSAPGTDMPVICFEQVGELKSWFDKQHFENTRFLVKGSRGIKLEEVL
jgi:UDP-N-acetylmuramoyl-tripeptide--D-alanyl-D-alanine ligase